MEEKFEYIDKLDDYFLNSLEDYDNLRIYKFQDFDLKWLKRILDFGEDIFGDATFDRFSIVFQIYYGNVYILKEKRDSKEMEGIAAFSRAWDDNQLVYLSDFAVSENVKGQSIGTEFLSSVLQDIESQGFNKIRLTVDPDNDPAIGLYEKLNFEIVEEVKNLYGPGDHRYIMELQI